MRFILVPVLISLCLNAVFSLENSCPAAGDIEPCSCDDRESNFIKFTCHSVLNVDDLRTAFQNADGYNYASILIRNSSLIYIPHEVFEKTPAKYLTVQDTILQGIFDSPPQNVRSIVGVNLFNVSVRSGVEWNNFQGFTNLQTLSVRDTYNIGILRPSFSNYLSKKLSLLAFVNSEITKIKPGALSALPNLKEVIFNNCGITGAGLTRDMFPRPSQLSGISFYNNKITSLPEDFFTDMPNVHHIHLGNNRLTTVPESVFNRSSIQYLFLGGNPISCGCDMQYLLKKEHVKVYVGGKCATPPRLQGKRIDDLTPSDISCFYSPDPKTGNLKNLKLRM